MIKTVLIDGDTLYYRLFFSFLKSENQKIINVNNIKSLAHKYISNILSFVSCDTYIGLIKNLESRNRNFRYYFNPLYKDNRNSTITDSYTKALSLIIRNILIEDFKFKPVLDLELNYPNGLYGVEVDDIISLINSKYMYDPELDVYIFSTDKDFNQLPGKHIKPTTNNWLLSDSFILDIISIPQANIHFYTQCLMGDRTDNIEGIKGIGIVKATELLKDKVDLFEAVTEAYFLNYGKNIITFRKIVETYKCLRLLSPNDLAKPFDVEGYYHHVLFDFNTYNIQNELTGNEEFSDLL